MTGDAKKVRPGFIHPSAAFTLRPRQMKFYKPMQRTPEIGYVVYGRIAYLYRVLRDLKKLSEILL